jgi:hypothetical protein
MTTITLPRDLEERLIDEAKRRGTTPDALAVATLRQSFAATPADQSQAKSPSLLDYLGDFVGAVDGSSEPLSQDCGRRFEQYLIEKHERESP